MKQAPIHFEQHSAWTLDILNYLDQGISVFDHDMRLVAWNERMLELLDLPPELAKYGQPLEVFFRFNAGRGEYGSGNIDVLVAERMSLARTFASHVFDRVRPDGSVIEVRGNPMPNNSGFVTTYTDVTEQRHAEARLEKRVAQRTEEYRRESEAHRKTAEALRKSELWIRQIADAVPALIAYVDKDNCYRFINNMHQEWFGLDRKQLIGTSIFDLVESRNLEQFHKDIDAVLQGQEIQTEYVLGRKGRTPLDVSISFIPHFDEQGQMLGYFFLGQDLTEYKQTQRELVESQKMQALGRLTGGMAHDFNNLLTIILGNLNFLEDYDDGELDPHETREAIQCCAQAAQRGSELIQRMLTFSRRQALKPEPTNLNELVEDFSVLLQRTLGETIRIQRQLAHGLPSVLVDRNQLEACLLNLTLNARDSMPRGGRLVIRTELYNKTAYSLSFNDLPAGEYIMLSVRDEGEGMSSETISRAFEPFYTTKPAGVGTGLGLSMVYGFVKQSGGGIDIKSKLGEGTTVRLILPVEHEHPQQRKHKTPQAKQPSQHANVLLVEDDVGVRQFVQRALHKMGYNVDLAENGEFALEKLTQSPPYDVVLTDIVMPGKISGLDLYSRISQDYPHTQVLCMTGYSEQVESTLSEKHLLRKPFLRNQLATKLQELLKTEHA